MNKKQMKEFMKALELIVAEKGIDPVSIRCKVLCPVNAAEKDRLT